MGLEKQLKLLPIGIKEELDARQEKIREIWLREGPSLAYKAEKTQYNNRTTRLRLEGYDIMDYELGKTRENLKRTEEHNRHN